jgi:ubiquinone/menaquinone biosynthesis C-methylase UbiE
MSETKKDYIPALSYDFLTPFYDPLIKLGLRETAFKTAMLNQADILPGQRVLDLACGTGTLTVMAKKANPQAEIIGLDGDRRILGIAHSKAGRENVAVRFDEGFSTELPYGDGLFDRVLSSLFFHHLKREDKRRTLREVRRVLAPDGELYVADWGKPDGLLMKAASLPVQWLDGPTTRDNFQGMLPEFIAEAGFAEVTEMSKFNTVGGTIRLYKAANK